jgi:hypothetical protein
MHEFNGKLSSNKWCKAYDIKTLNDLIFMRVSIIQMHRIIDDGLAHDSDCHDWAQYHTWANTYAVTKKLVYKAYLLLTLHGQRLYSYRHSN